jgi:lysophospholipase L1-like esterase
VKWITLGIALILSGCGGSGTADTAPVVKSTPPVVSQPDPPPPPPAPTPPPPAPIPPPAPTPPPPPVVVFMGDSITAGWVALATLVPGSVNAGIPGQTSVQMLERFQTDVIVAQSEVSVVVILAGTNDIALTQDPNTDNIASMAAMATAAGIKVILCTIPPDSINAIARYGFNVTQADVDAKTEAMNAAIFALAKQYGYQVADYYDALILSDGSQSAALFRDGTHPNAAGYDVMWPVLKPKLQALDVTVE